MVAPVPPVEPPEPPRQRAAMALQGAWLSRRPLAWLLWPLSWVYDVLVMLRSLPYLLGLRRRERLPVPVVVVGNVVAGGAGKTPVVIAMVEHLQRRGLQVGVISRGWGRADESAVRLVGDAATAAEVGDEPLLVHRRTGAPVAVGRLRVEAGRALLAAHPHTQVIVSDDGLQHLPLAPDITLCVFDARGLGNGFMLPAGPLREPWPRPVDFVLRTDATQGVSGHLVRRRLAEHAVRADGTRVPLAQLRGQPLHALAGIAQPEAFFAGLVAQGLTLAQAEPLPDHYDFDSGITSWDADQPLICTEKDAVKLWRLRPDAWAVPLEVELGPGFWMDFDRALDAKLSSADGSQTA